MMEVGDMGKVFDINSRTMGAPDDGWDAEITEIRRTRMSVRYNGRTEDFYIHSRRVADTYGHRTFVPLGELSREQRAKTVLEELSARGFILDVRARNTPAGKLEAIVRILDSPNP